MGPGHLSFEKRGVRAGSIVLCDVLQTSFSVIIMNHIRLLAFCVLIVVMAGPTSAAVVLSTVSYTPDPPLLPGTQQHVAANYAVIPSGATTFAKGHELELQTGLADAEWTIQVTQDGRNVARQTGSGNVAFVNGEILSYTTSHDIGMIVTVGGTVPQGAQGTVMVIDLKEIDNSGNVVPGSEIALTQPVAGITPLQTPSVPPTLTPPLVTPTTPAAKSPGFAAPVCLAVLAATSILRMRCRQCRCTGIS